MRITTDEELNRILSGKVKDEEDEELKMRTFVQARALREF